VGFDSNTRLVYARRCMTKGHAAVLKVDA
jgi:hypothetical protein